MIFPTSLQSIGAFIAILLVGGYAIRRALLPKPIPGMAYKKSSAQKVVGNGLELLRWKAEHGEMFGYLANLALELNAPIFQIFIHPFGKPWVVIADNREAYDIMVRRTSKEFDRSQFLRDLLGPLVPEFHFHMPTGDGWKAHRKLVADTMSPGFLGEVAGPQMRESTLKVIELWRVKERLAEGRPFSVATDLRKAAFEIIWAATFGFETGSIKVQSDLLSSLPMFEDLPGIDQAVEFPVAADPPVFKAVLALNDALNIGVNSFLPRLSLNLAYSTFPSLRAARSLKEAVIQDEIKKAIEKFSNKTDIDWEEQGNMRRHMKSAVDIVIARELESARKEGRAPDLLSRVVQDELFSFLLAGNEIYTLTAWALKFLTAHQDVQTSLRKELRDQFTDAAETGVTPTVPEINAARLPYFEAFVEETTRCGQITQTNIRTTQQDVVILGHPIPKHTEVLMLNNGPGTFMPPLRVEESKRSESSKATNGKVGEWDLSGMKNFHPERWLVEDNEGRLSFNPSAGPRHSFGGGSRACFGK
jgi:cytochrome P450